MYLKPFNYLLCRTPAFGTNELLKDIFEQLLPKINESSPDFFKRVQNLKAVDLEQLDEKTWFTLWKYFNRAKYRATPFGTFSAISILPILGKPLQAIGIAQVLDQHHLIDWNITNNNLNHLPEKASSFLTNSSVYLVGKQFRYLKWGGQPF